jgi:glycerate dehydrogenase
MTKSPLIVVLDGHTLNPGDLSWKPLEALGDLRVYDRSAPEEVVPRAANAGMLLTNKALLPRSAIHQLSKLEYIGVTATGYNVVDIQAARERNIVVTNVPIYGTNSVAQMVFAHLLNLTQRVDDHARAVRAGRWAGAVDWCFWDFPLVELEGLAMGIVGMGRIGRATAKLANAFGMRVMATSRSDDELPGHVERADLDTLFRTSDVVSLHCPLTEQTRQLVNRERLALMKPSAFLINTSRGPLVEEAALAAALNAGQLAGAGLDVVYVEPPTGGNPLFTAKNCYVTPHIAWATLASRRRLMETTVDNVAAFLHGEPQHVVNL